METVEKEEQVGNPEQELIETDPVLLMLGVGRQFWNQEPGDDFVERLRSEDAPQRSR